MSEEKFVGYMVSFDIGTRFKVKAYMKEDYYNEWKFFRDKAITDVWVEEAEVEMNYFLG